MFTHLHLHTEYSLLDGANKIKELAKNMKNFGFKACAMTDHGNMFGAIDFYQTMKKEGIKPIIGLEAYIHNSEQIGDKSTRQRSHLCLFAKNEIGYKNLMFLSSQSYLEGFYYNPRINKKMLKEHSEGLICSSACLQGEINWHLNLNNERNVKAGAKGYERAKEVALEYKEIFKDDFYLELMRHGIDDQLFIDSQIIKLSLETGIKIIATNDTHYPFKENAQSHEVFMCIAMKKEFDDPKRLRHSVHEFYIKTEEQMRKLFADIPEAIDNTQEIVDKCNLEIKLGNPTPPNFKFTIEWAKKENIIIPNEDKTYDLQNDSVLFEHLCKKGLNDRLKYIDKNKHEIYHERLNKEIQTIVEMKFPGYMMIVWDFIREAKQRKVPVGPGRGSAAGSLVAYALKITDIDPIPYDLLFERFLNPARISMPDIDVDFCRDRRGEIIDYVSNKYGTYNVAQVITFGKLLAKGVIRDVARVLGMPYNQADKMAKLIPDKIGINLMKGKGVKGESGYVPSAYEQEPKIKELIESDELAQKVWENSIALEHLNRNAGIHAAGVVISNEELWHKVPIYQPSNTTTKVTQYSLKYLEDVDLIKFDFLGLKTLTVISEAIKLIEQRHDKQILWEEINLNDEKVYKTLQSGYTLGLFQIESGGMQELNERLKPSNFEDIIAVVALYRPGPMGAGMHNDFIDRKHGRAEITYDFAELEPVLKPTYGVIVYQEQVMQIVQIIGGFSLAKADLVRRAMGKKIKEELDNLKAEFVQGAISNGFDKTKSENIFDLILKFAEYGFNKSHSAAYAMICFQTAYLKTYYPQEFLAALLTSEKDNTNKIVRYIDEARRLGYDVVPPSVKLSNTEFISKNHEGKEVIIFGLSAIKGVGKKAISSILKQRDEKDFSSLDDFISRIDPFLVNKKVLESLIKSGSFDCFGENRKTLLNNIDILVESAQKAVLMKKSMQNSLFGEVEEELKINLNLNRFEEEIDIKEILKYEKESIGLYTSGHPLDNFREDIVQIKHTSSAELEDLDDGSDALFVGIIEEIHTKITKKGNKIYLLDILDLHGNIEGVLMFENVFEKLSQLDRTKPLAFKVKINKNERFTNMNLNKVLTLKEAKKEKYKTIMRDLSSDEPIILELNIHEDQGELSCLLALVQKNTGKRQLHLNLNIQGKNVLVKSDYKVNDEFLEDAKDLNFISEISA